MRPNSRLLAYASQICAAEASEGLLDKLIGKAVFKAKDNEPWLFLAID
jgi:hypothetical protein